MTALREFSLDPSNMKRCYQCDKLAPELSQRGRCMSCVEKNYEEVAVLNDSMMTKYAELQLSPVTNDSQWIDLEDFVEKNLGRPGMVLDVAPVELCFKEYGEEMDEYIDKKVLNVPIEQVNTVIEAMKVMASACSADEDVSIALRLSRFNAVNLGE